MKLRWVLSFALILGIVGALAWGAVRLVRDTRLMAEVVASNSVGAIAFKDRQAANDTLKSVAVRDDIVSAAIWTKGRDLRPIERQSFRELWKTKYGQ